MSDARRRTFEEFSREGNIENEAQALRMPFKLTDVVKSQFGIAVICFVFVLLLLYLLNPPFTQRSAMDSLVIDRQSTWKMLLTAFTISGLVYAGPPVFRWLTSYTV